MQRLYNKIYNKGNIKKLLKAEFIKNFQIHVLQQQAYMRKFIH